MTKDRRRLVLVSAMGAAMLAIIALPIVCAVTENRDRATTPTPEVIPPAPNGETACPELFSQLALDRARRAECWCDGARYGAAWGTNQYTQDSSVCGSARHAHLTTYWSGARIHVEQAPGCPRYVGTTSYDVTSFDLPASPSSFFFVGHGDGSCSQTFGQVTAAGTTKADNDGALMKLPAPHAACPANLSVPSETSPTELQCHCAAPIASAPVWGDHRYALDSGVCAAALHAGAVTAAGGVVRLRLHAGCARYASARRAGITSRAGDGGDASFAFETAVETTGSADDATPSCPP